MEAMKRMGHDQRGGGSTLKRGRRFEERVAHLLTLLGYRVEREQLEGGGGSAGVGGGG